MELLRPFSDEVRIDRLGNVIGVKRCGVAGAKKLLLDAHLDEVGIIVTGIEEGFLRFHTLGGIDTRLLPAREIRLLTDPPVSGFVTCLPPHVLEKGEEDKAIPLDKLFLDIGLNQSQAERMVKIGTTGVFQSEMKILGEHQVSARAIDDRAGFAVLLRAAELIQSVGQAGVDIYFLGSVREETNGAGAITAAYGIQPDWCVAVDMTHGRTPDAPREETFPLGGGPAVGVGPNMTKTWCERLITLAQERKIPYSIEVMAGNSGTNGWHFQVSREGIPTAVLSVPVRYMHSPVETVDLRDIESTAQLLSAFVGMLGHEVRAC